MFKLFARIFVQQKINQLSQISLIRFLNVKICWFSLFYVTVRWTLSDILETKYLIIQSIKQSAH